MANQRISDLTAGTPPYPGTTLFELDVSGATRSGKLSDLVPSTFLDQWIIDWDSNTPVISGTSIVLLASQWTSCTILSCTYSCTGGSFTLNIQHNETSVTGLGTLSVGSSPITTPATGNNVLSHGDNVSLVISSVTGSPAPATVQINYQKSAN
jgi:hypothetical protein